MPFRYSAFLSYRHSEGSLAGRFVSGLYDLLSEELELLVPEPVFFDQRAFKDKPFSEQALAEALCESVCMIVVFSPVLFDEQRPYPALEYTAMLTLEAKRLQILPPEDLRQGLIIPIILRGRESIPAEMLNNRIFYNFSDYYSSTNLKRRSDYAKRISQIARYIAQRCEIYRALPEAFNDASSFCLPEREHVIHMIRGSRSMRRI
jgi:hypothetical protein